LDCEKIGNSAEIQLSEAETHLPLTLQLIKGPEIGRTKQREYVQIAGGIGCI
jgi:hypothetical protein